MSQSNEHPKKGADRDINPDRRSDESATTTQATTVAEQADLTRFQITILDVLAEHDGEDYGQGIKRGLESYYGEEINHGRLYPNLDELDDRGFIEKIEREVDNRTNTYALTDAGRDVRRIDLERRLDMHDHRLAGAAPWEADG